MPGAKFPASSIRWSGRKMMATNRWCWAPRWIVCCMSKAQSEDLIAELEAWFTQDKYIYQHEWHVNDLLIWFNSTTMHQAVEYAGSERRLFGVVTQEGVLTKVGPIVDHFAFNDDGKIKNMRAFFEIQIGEMD